MQSQQKRVKWSRGETAEAIEERTDTGVTQASVEFMENCIPDIYGNISRRPALKMIPYSVSFWNNGENYGFAYDEYLQVIPFYITETDFILIGVHFTDTMELIRIKDGTAYYRKRITGAKTGVEESGLAGVYSYRPVSYAQQGNYLLIADGYNVWQISISNYDTNNYSFDVTCVPWRFSAGWYAPNGTQTKQVNDSVIAGLSISGNASGYVYTDNISGQTTVYSQLDTGLTGSANMAAIESEIPAGSIVAFPNNGAHMRVEGYYLTGGNVVFPDVVFDAAIALNGAETLPVQYQTGKVCVARKISTPYFEYYNNGVLVEMFPTNAPYSYVAFNVNFYIRSSTAPSGEQYGAFTISGISINFTWANAQSGMQKVYMYGSLLTPVADENATDKIVSVEYGYVSLQPSAWAYTASFPHPRKLVFNEQRLWAAGWAYSKKEQYAITLGSQIARYNDLKNDYNQENEPITLDILTQYKEKIVHLVDYNGLKIMTDAFEYAYNKDTGIVKQSANGSFEYCEPIVFDSLCLYVDSTGCQVKAMQYEFQSNIFNSSTINQYTPHDLVWYPWGMATYEDKIHSTGKYLFLVNREDANTRLAVCNFVPSNQANIWSRWKFPTISIPALPSPITKPLVHSIVNTKNEPIFLVTMKSGQASYRILPSLIDFGANTDFDSAVYIDSNNNTPYFSPIHHPTDVQYFYVAGIVMPNTEVAIYSDGEFKFLATTGDQGQITADLTGLTNIKVGLPINSTIISHPIDVGGKTKSIKKRIGKAVMSVHDTPNDARGSISINGKTGYMNPQGDKINFYGVTGMKDEIKYTITNKNGAMFHLESLLMNIEYGTLDS